MSYRRSKGVTKLIKTNCFQMKAIGRDAIRLSVVVVVVVVVWNRSWLGLRLIPLHYESLYVHAFNKPVEHMSVPCAAMLLQLWWPTLPCDLFPRLI